MLSDRRDHRRWGHRRSLRQPLDWSGDSLVQASGDDCWHRPHPAGGGLRWWAILTLGRYFTFDVAVRASQPVVQSGPYRLIRHPAYSGTLLVLLGIGLALANWASIAAILAGVLIGLRYRVRVEEQALIDGLGQPYVDYMRHTKRFVPFIF